jgi:hypothetical protein
MATLASNEMKGEKKNRGFRWKIPRLGSLIAGAIMTPSLFSGATGASYLVTPSTTSTTTHFVDNSRGCVESIHIGKILKSSLPILRRSGSFFSFNTWFPPLPFDLSSPGKGSYYLGIEKENGGNLQKYNGMHGYINISGLCRDRAFSESCIGE